MIRAAGFDVKLLLSRLSVFNEVWLNARNCFVKNQKLDGADVGCPFGVTILLEAELSWVLTDWPQYALLMVRL
ncbi:MAG: hypothetical protein ACKERG_01255 [Candidatus Hodgkinia cicadicola]